MRDVASIRQLFPALSERVYLYSGMWTPAAHAAREAMESWLEAWTHNPGEMWDKGWEDVNAARSAFARLIGASTDEIVATDSTSHGLNLAVQMIDPKPGANIVSNEFEHMSDVYPWMVREGVQIRYAQPRGNYVHPEDVEALIDENTVAINISHVSPIRGFKHNLLAIGEIAKRHGVYFIVDAAQTAGAVQIDVRAANIDFLACPTCKWLLGIVGGGFLYVNEKLVKRFAPPHVGWASAQNWSDADLHHLKLHNNGLKFQPGMPSFFVFAVARRGMELLLDVGMDIVEERVTNLSLKCLRGLQERGVNLWTPEDPEHRAGLVSAEIPDAERFFSYLSERKIEVGCSPRRNLIRVDTHLFNSDSDIDAFLEAFDSYRRSS